MTYVNSKNIKVYPTANRKQPFDPESIYRGEANTILANKLISPNKDGSYVVTENYDSTKPLEFILGGYYFKIKNPGNVFTTASNYYAGIVVDYRSAEQSEEADINNQEFSNKILKNLTGIIESELTPNNCLDNSGNNFTGLYIYTDNESQTTINKFTYKIHLLHKDDNVYIIPATSKFAFDTRLIKDINRNDAHDENNNLSDYFKRHEFNYPEDVRVNHTLFSSKIDCDYYTHAKQIKYENPLFLTCDNGSISTCPSIYMQVRSDNPMPSYLQNKLEIRNRENDLNVKINKIQSTKVQVMNELISNNALCANKLTSSAAFVDSVYLRPSDYKIEQKGEVKTISAGFPEGEDQYSLQEDLILYSTAHNDKYSSYSIIDDNLWNPTETFFERKLEHVFEEDKPVVERFRFGGLGNVVKDYPYMSVSNFYNKSGLSHEETPNVPRDCFGWTEIGGKPLKVKPVTTDNGEANVTRYINTEYNSSKLSSDGLTLHAPLRTVSYKSKKWKAYETDPDPGYFTFEDIKVGNLNAYFYMNEKSIAATVRPYNAGEEPSSESTAPISDRHYQVSGKFKWTSGLVIGAGYTSINMNPEKLPAGDDLTNMSITKSPIPILISNGIDPKDINYDGDLVGAWTRVLLNSEGQSELDIVSPSDERLKYNIHKYYPVNSILDVPVKEFTYKDSNKTTIGFIAQDLQKYFPQLVTTNDSGYLTIAESKIVYLLLEEVKKLRKEVDELKK